MSNSDRELRAMMAAGLVSVTLLPAVPHSPASGGRGRSAVAGSQHLLRPNPHQSGLLTMTDLNELLDTAQDHLHRHRGQHQAHHAGEQDPVKQAGGQIPNPAQSGGG